MVGQNYFTRSSAGHSGKSIVEDPLHVQKLGMSALGRLQPQPYEFGNRRLCINERCDVRVFVRPKVAPDLLDETAACGIVEVWRLIECAVEGGDNDC